MFKYIKLTDTHLRDNNLDHKIPALSYVAQAAIERGVNAVLHAGDLVDHDSFGGKLATPGGVVEAYYNAFARPLEQAGISILIARGNHDKKSANRGSALWNFMGIGSTVTFETVGRMPFSVGGKIYNIVFAPWLYPEEVIGTRPAEMSEQDYHAAYVAEVESRIVAQLYQPTGTPEANILVAHCRFAGASLSTTKVSPSGEGMVLSRELLSRFDDLHLGDIHMRQGILDRGGFTGALTQEGFDEEGNACGVELVTMDQDGINREWIEVPMAKRYQTMWVDDPGEAANPPELPPHTARTIKYLNDGSPRSKEIAAALEPLARQGIKIEPQFASREQVEVAVDTTRLDNPHAALDLYAEAVATEESQLAALHTELDDLLGGGALTLPDSLHKS